jgi:hypothetical protein
MPTALVVAPLFPSLPTNWSGWGESRRRRDGFTPLAAMSRTSRTLHGGTSVPLFLPRQPRARRRTMNEPHIPSFDPKPPRLAVDANGYVWRVYDEYWSMCPVNPDNSPIPQPVTFYDPASAASEETKT